MKLLKLSIILLFMQLLFFTSLSAQEDENANTLPSSISDIMPAGNEDEGIVDKEKENTITPDLTNKGKTEKDDDAQKKPSTKKKPEAKVVQKTEVIKTEETKTEETKTEEIKIDKPEPVKIDEGLLLIDDGNFKYRRIPDIKLIDKTPELIVKNIAVETPKVENEQKKEKSYIDIWKILIILIIVGIFILYVSRASGSAKKMNNKTSKSRKVLNSYRK
jgi:hypothetical protein